jgi:superfamily I DNA/RNA helicase
MHRYIVIGPPGTGKTTYLKNKVQELIKSGACTSQQIVILVLPLKQQKRSETELWIRKS